MTKIRALTLTVVITMPLSFLAGYFFAEKNGQMRQARMHYESDLLDEENSAPCGEPTIKSDHVVCYTESGYWPVDLSIHEGESVLFIRDQQAAPMWTASDRHPDHANYNESSITEHCEQPSQDTFDQCGNTDSFLFQFNKSGSWDYHNHSLSVHTGRVNVH